MIDLSLPVWSNVDEVLTDLNLHPEIKQTVLDCSSSHVPTKHHQEDLLTHLFLCGQNMVRFAPHFVDNSISKRFLFLIGFLHDIGKPFAKKNIFGRKEKINYSCHAQLGARFVQLCINQAAFPPNFFNYLLFCVDNHMCYLSHNQPFQQNVNVKEYWNFILNSNLSLIDKSLAVDLCCLLFTADSCSAIQSIVKDENTILNYNLELKDKLKKDLHLDVCTSLSRLSFSRKTIGEKILIFPIGLSGSGKSTFSNLVYDTFKSQDEIVTQRIKSRDKTNIVHVERDSCYFEIYNQYNPCQNHVDYSTVYQWVRDQTSNGILPKDTVQQLWCKKLNTALESSAQVIIIDTVQTSYHHAWKQTTDMLNEDAKSNYLNAFKISVYFLPLRQFGIQHTSKIGQYMSLPDFTINYNYINAEMGTWDNYSFDFGTGVPQFAIDFVKAIINFNNKKVVCPPQKNLLALISQSGGKVENIIQSFPQGILELHTEYNDKITSVKSVSYKDGCQTFVADTRDYRGEVILSIDSSVSLLRGSLPVFPDFNSIYKDPKCFDYMHELYRTDTVNIPYEAQDALHICRHWVLSSPVKKPMFYVTPKFDGSMFNLTFIPASNKNYLQIVEIANSLRNAWINVTQKGCYFFGSKGRLAVTNTNAVKIRILNAICGTYGTISAFLEKIEQVQIEMDKDEAICFHFEAIDEIPSSELTVYYGKAWCPYFGYTLFNTISGDKRYYLPLQTNCPLFEQSPVYKFESWKELFDFYHSQLDMCLKGDLSVEPEGYVVTIVNTMTKEQIPFKLKYPFYYIAHKPNTNRNAKASQEISTNPKYDLLRNRLAKFREKVELTTLLSDLAPKLVSYYLSFIIPNQEFSSKRDWALFWTQYRETVTNDVMNLQKDMLKYYPSAKFNGFGFVMGLYPEQINVQNILSCLHVLLVKK